MNNMNLKWIPIIMWVGSLILGIALSIKILFSLMGDDSLFRELMVWVFVIGIAGITSIMLGIFYKAYQNNNDDIKEIHKQ